MYVISYLCFTVMVAKEVRDPKKSLNKVFLFLWATMKKS